jgi:hypothetical protein
MALHPETERQLVVQKGRIVSYRLFDMADAISLELAETLVKPSRPRRGALRRDVRSLVFARAPVDVKLDDLTLTLPRTGQQVGAEMFARLFEYGAVSVSFEIAIPPGTSIGEMLPMCDELYETTVLEEIARPAARKLLDGLGAAVQGRHEWEGVETYTIVFVERFEAEPLGFEVLASPLLAPLVLGEPGPKRLAVEQRGDVLKHAHSYFEDDLVVIDWNSAFVLEPSGSREILEILEFATSQLLELRYYDGVFDAELARVYDDLEKVRRATGGVFRSPYTRLGREVMLRLVELTEFAERIDNALKVIGDFYLARVYQSAVSRFGIAAWQGSIDAKQGLIAQALGLIKGENDTRRSTFLELTVILLIFLELVTAMIRPFMAH